MAVTIDGTNGITSSGSITTSSASGVIFSDSSALTAAASPYVLKNRIINGAMQVWQRGTSVSGTYVYGTDRWATLPFATCNIAQSTSVPTTTGNLFQYSAKVGRTASSTATTPIGIMQTIESNNCYDLSGQSVTFSFWAKAGANYSASGSALGVQVNTGTVADQGGSSYTSWTGGASPINTAATLTTSWQKFTYTGTFGSGVLEAAVLFFYTPSGTAGADDNFYITGVQLEIGSTATPFERRLYNQELANCQRYLPAWNMTAVNQVYGQGQATSTSSALIYLPFKVSARVAPTGITASAAANFYLTTSTYSVAGTYASTVFSYGSTEGIVITSSCGSGLTAGNCTTLGSASTSGQILATGCEL